MTSRIELSAGTIEYDKADRRVELTAPYPRPS